MPKSDGIKKQSKKRKSFEVMKPTKNPNQIYIARFTGSYEMKSLQKV